ncbi:MAG: carboxypeptidase-like regulatory domain-containing protein [Colwellia sp.]
MFVSLLFACKTNQGLPDNIMVSGLVTDSEGDPVSGVSISIFDLGVEFQSASDGSFSITSKSPDNFTFTLKNEGYYSTQKIKSIEGNVELISRVLSSIKDSFGRLVSTVSPDTPSYSGPALFKLNSSEYV